MRLLHISDWHLGRLTYRCPRTPDHESVLEEILELARDVRPWPDQPWSEKVRRIARASLNPLSPKSEHDRRWGLGRWRQHRAGS